MMFSKLSIFVVATLAAFVTAVPQAGVPQSGVPHTGGTQNGGTQNGGIQNGGNQTGNKASCPIGSVKCCPYFP